MGKRIVLLWGIDYNGGGGLVNCLKRGVGFEEAVLFDRWDSRVGNREYGFVSFSL